MKVVNLGDPFTKRLTLRLTELQYDHIIRMAGEFNISPSDYVRYLIYLSGLRFEKELFNSGGTSNENVKTCFDDNV